MRPLNLRSVVTLFVLAVSVFSGSIAMGQDAETDRARALLKEGAAHYKTLKFKDAQAVLLKVDRDRLSDAQKKQLDGYLSKVNGDIKQQDIVLKAYNDGEEALEAGNLDEAGRLFEKVAKSEYAPASVRKDARTQRALVAGKKIAIAKAAVAAKPKTATVRPDLPAPTATAPATKPAVKPAVKVVKTDLKEVARQVRLKKLQDGVDKAKAAIKKGDEALNKGQIARAIVHFERAVKESPGYKPARKRLADARRLVGTESGLAAITRLEKIRRIKKQETEVRYNQALQRAHEAMQAPRGKEDFDKAKNEVQYAQIEIETKKSVFTDAEYRKKKIETDKRLEYISMVKTRWERQQVEKQRIAIEKRKVEREMGMIRRKNEQIAMMKAQVRILRNDNKYERAVEICKRIQKLDPNDQWAAEWYTEMNRFVKILAAKKTKRIMLENELEQFDDIRRSAIPWYELLTYPEDWQEVRAKHLSVKDEGLPDASGASYETRRILNKPIEELKFEGIAFKDVIQFLSDIRKCNIHVKWPVLGTAGVEKTTQVNVHLTNVTLKKALDTVLEDVGTEPLGFVVDEGVITISTKADLARKTITRVYDIRDLIFRVPNFRGPRINISQPGDDDDDDDDDDDWADDDDDDDDDDDREPGQRQLMEEIRGMIRGTIDAPSWEREGISIEPWRGQMVVTQTAENHRGILSLLEKLRQAQALQINVEARIITVSSGFLSHVGIDLDFYFNLGSSLTRQMDPASGAWAVDPLTGARLTGAGRWTMDPVTGALTPPANNPNMNIPQWHGGRWTNNMTPVTMGMGSYGFTHGLQTGVGGNIGAAATGLSGLEIAGTFLDDIQVDFLVSATQAHTSTRMLTAPRITFFNNQQAYVRVGRQVAYVATLEPVVDANVSAIRPDIQREWAGTTLNVEGTISANRDYVTLTIGTGERAINRIDRFAWGSEGFIQLPDVTGRELECTVSVPNGGTLLLGGQKTAGETEREMGVPVLSKIPILNRIFTHRAKVRDDETLLIMVKPTIIDQKVYELDAFPPSR